MHNLAGQALSLWEKLRQADLHKFRAVLLGNNNEEGGKSTKQIFCLSEILIFKAGGWKECFCPFRMLEMIIVMKPFTLTDVSFSYFDIHTHTYI